MTRFSYISTVFMLLIFHSSFSQKKTLFANRIGEPMTIDGKLDEEIWTTTETATDFIMYAPDNGKPIAPEKKTDVRILYDDDAIYISAVMLDDQPDKILKEITQRDVFGTAEHFGVFINGYNDGQQDFRFYVSSAGVQMDCITTEENGEDFSWDAIWESDVTITDSGWIAEMKIPYAALRFSSEDKQSWGVNFYRELRRDRQQYTWNLIDTKIGLEITQTGNLEGIEQIKTPTRLFFFPYSSYYYDTNKDGSNSTFKAGLDIKYGINDAFTLDAILVPDFGQTRYDNVELNLGPFEQQFNENRPFFTEGTDLFNKGNLFYSRRIGGAPSTIVAPADENYKVDNPQSVDLINAVKISGRTKNGLGIGVLNAVTEKTYATVTHIPTGVTNEVLVEPVANYNVFVLDQRFRKNSSVSFVNTNVMRNSEFRDANVSAIVFDLNTRSNTYKVAGDFKFSHVNEYADFDDRNGYSTYLKFAETAGKYRYDFGGVYVSDEYDNNDLGINFQTHYHSLFADASYRILNPSKNFNTFTVATAAYSEFENITGRAQSVFFSTDVNYFTLKNDYFSYVVTVRPVTTYDFYEPRFDGRFVELPKSLGGSFLFSSNYNRKFAVDVSPSATFADEPKRESFGFYIQPRYRFNDRFTTTFTFNYVRQNNNVGYVDDSYVDESTPYDIYFAKRNRSTYTLTSGAKYSVNKDMTLTLNARYYWSYAENTSFYTLADDGSLIPSTYDENQDSNFSTWNLDLSYSWWFAPGSQISVLYRNNADAFTRDINKDFNQNFSNVLEENLNHVFSISIRYFIDYNRAKNWF